MIDIMALKEVKRSTEDAYTWRRVSGIGLRL